MATPRTRMRLVLLQVRDGQAPLRQEQSCFIERCRLARRQFTFRNLVDHPDLKWRDVANAHAVLIGGAGAFSVTDSHPFSEPLHEVVLRLVETDRPVFGSCWGHQYLASIFGGQVVEDRARSEVGTFAIELTEAGRTDPLFDEFPSPFHVQLGHNDRVTEIGPDTVELARSVLCPFQAIRLRDKPVYGTQFHSEMNEERLRERLAFYRDEYAADQATYEAILRGLRPSIDADRLMERFLELYA